MSLVPFARFLSFLSLFIHSVTLGQPSSIQLEYDISGFGKFYTKGVLHYHEGEAVFFVKDTLSEKNRANAVGTEIPDLRNIPLTPEDIAAGRSAGSFDIEIERVPQSGDIDYHIQTDLNNNVRLSRKKFPTLNQTYIIKEQIRNIKWRLKSGKRVIANFECRKAVGQFGGRSYTVWYTPQIPIPVGPWKLDGLPGVIVEGSEDTRRIAFRLAVIRYDLPSPVVPDLDSSPEEVINCEKSLELHEKDAEVLIKRVKAKLPRGVTLGESESNEIQLECP